MTGAVTLPVVNTFSPESPVEASPWLASATSSWEADRRQRLASLRRELAQAVSRQMTSHPWRMSLTYLGAMRYSFAVSFDAQGKVQRVSGIWFEGHLAMNRHFTQYKKAPTFAVG